MKERKTSKWDGEEYFGDSISEESSANEIKSRESSENSSNHVKFWWETK